MLEVPEDVWAALGDTVVRTQTWAVATYQDANRRLDVDREGEITWQGDGADAQASGTITVYGYGDEHGGDLIPRNEDDLLYPGRGQEVLVNRDVMIGSAPYTIPLGVFRIVDDGDGGTWDTRAGRTATWRVPLTVADRLRMNARAKVIVPAGPQFQSMWDELQRLALTPLVHGDIADHQVPRTIAYDDRQTAIANLAALAAGVPSMNRQGALGIRLADRWADTEQPEFDIPGTIDWKQGHTDGFFNWVWAHDPDGRYNGFAALTDEADPKSVNRAGPVTYEHASPVYVSNAAAQKGAETTLDRLLHRRSHTVTVQVGMQGLCLDLGDVGWVRENRHNRAVMGEVAGIRISNNPSVPIDLTLIVAEQRG